MSDKLESKHWDRDQSSLRRSILRDRGRHISIWLLLFSIVLVVNNTAYPQTPFTTDDSDVTEKGEFGFEFLNGYARLQPILYPARSQNIAVSRLNYGLVKNVEIGIDVPFVVVNIEGIVSRRHFGIADVSPHIKVRLRKEKEGSRVPAFAVVFNIRFPTGKVSKGLGSGVANYQLYGIAQKSITSKTVIRANLGVLFAGNTISGPLGTVVKRGKLFAGSVSIVNQFTEKLRLGAELVTVPSRNPELSVGQLQTMVGGNYQLTNKLSLDFGVVAGRFPASPRVAGLIGFSFSF